MRSSAPHWITGLCLVLLFASGCSSGSYPLDIFPEMHYQVWHRPLEPERLTPPEDAVPRTGAAPRIGWSDAAEFNRPPDLGADAAVQGARVYARDCAMCHGARGQGDGPIAPYYQQSAAGVVPPVALTGQRVQSRSDGELWWLIRNGIGNMPPYDRLLTERDTWLTVVYIRALAGQP